MTPYDLRLPWNPMGPLEPFEDPIETLRTTKDPLYPLLPLQDPLQPPQVNFGPPQVHLEPFGPHRIPLGSLQDCLGLSKTQWGLLWIPWQPQDLLEAFRTPLECLEPQIVHQNPNRSTLGLLQAICDPQQSTVHHLLRFVFDNLN